MHLLVAAHDLHPDPSSGGTGRYVHETGRRLADRGHEVTVVTRRRGEVPEAERVAGMRVLRYDLSVDGEHGLAIARQLPRAWWTLGSQLDGLQPDVVSFQATVTEPLVDALVPDEVPRSATVHSPWPVEYAIKAGQQGSIGLRERVNVELRRAIEARMLDRCEQVIALSAFMAERAREVHGELEAAIVPGGVDPERFHPATGEVEAMTEAEVAFLTVRRLSPRMGHDVLLRAFADVVDENEGARLFVAGDGPLRSGLEARAERLGVAEQVEWLGYVPEAELGAVMSSADVFVLPTQRLEGFGLATVEALAAGTPVVATPVGATPEILADLAAAWPAPGLSERADAQALSAAMQTWTDLDADQRAKAGGQGRRHVEKRYTWERVVDELEARYEALVER